MARGLLGLAMQVQNSFNKREAWRDWANMCKRAAELKRVDLIRKHRPPFTAGWKTIDKRTARLRAELEQ